MATASETIHLLQNLDLSVASEDEINALLLQFGRFGLLDTILHPSYQFIRARLLQPGQLITKTDELSYKPQIFNKTYQRASTPNKTMFYAGLLQEENPYANLAIGRITGLLEGTSFMKDPSSSGIWRIAYGKWEAIEDIHVISICLSEHLVENNKMLKKIKNQYDYFVTEYPDLKDHSNEILTYLSNCFSKVDIKDHTDYKISALFTELVTKTKAGEILADGILYPSVRTDGDGINVAFKPEVLDSKKIILRAAAECSVFKSGMQVRVTNDKIVVLNGDEKEFKMKPIDDSKLEIQKKSIIKELGLKAKTGSNN